MANLDGNELDLPPSADAPTAAGPPRDPRVADALREPLLDFRRPLEMAWGWNRNGRPDDLAAAAELLARLVVRFPHVEPIWYEQAFNLMRRRPPARAAALAHLEKMERVFGAHLSEDTLSLWGRWHKDEGDARLTIGDRDPVRAEESYAKAQAKYADAYRQHHDRFPGINLATLAFLRAGLLNRQADPVRGFATGPDDRRGVGEMLDKVRELRRTAEDAAAGVLAGRPTWVLRLADDHIWTAATAAEASLLLGQWADAATLYATALRPDHKPQPFHFDSVVAQVRRLLAGYARLGEQPEGPMADYRTFFTQLAANANVSWTAPLEPETP